MFRQNPLKEHQVRRQVHADWVDRYLIQPFTVQFLLVAGIIAGFLLPATLLISLPLCVILLISFADQKFRLPLRIPEDIGGKDLSTSREVRGGFPSLHLTWARWEIGKAKGIMCLGRGRMWDLGKELWISLADCLRHMMVMATTGGGKTETLYTMFLNSLCWARGCVVGDGKATTELVAALFGLCRRFGREDDLYIVNFINGARDRFHNLIVGDKTLAQTNSSSPFVHGTAAFILQLMESLMPASGGSDEGWKDKARAMMNALIYALCYKRSRDGLVLSQAAIQAYLPLRKMVALYKEALENGWHEEGYKPLENYLSNLAGFDMDLIDNPSEWNPGVFDQHGFLIQQFTRMLGMFNDTYGHVFAKEFADIDMQDVLHNDRMLAVLIPALELSDNEAATLGKLYISDMRMNIAQALGGQLEGLSEETSNVKKFKSKFPFLLKFDEVGYYFADGMDKMAAQFRSLCFMLILLGQDVQAMMRRGNGQFESVNANIGTKLFLKTEDTKDTLTNAQSTAGKGYYSEQVRMERSGPLNNYQDANDVQIRERDNIELQELKALNSGEGVLVFENQVIRCASIYIPDEDKISSKLPVRLNRFLPMRKPTFEDLCSKVPAASQRRPLSEANISNILDISLYLAHNEPGSRLQERVRDVALKSLVSTGFSLDFHEEGKDPETRGIILFESVLESLKITGGSYKAHVSPTPISVSRKMLEEARANNLADALNEPPAPSLPGGFTMEQPDDVEPYPINGFEMVPVQDEPTGFNIAYEDFAWEGDDETL